MYGKKIRSIRILRGYSQDDMSKEMKIDTSKYSRIETDTQKPTAEILEHIAKILGVSIADIMCNEPVVLQTSSSHNDQYEVEKMAHFYSDQKELYEKIILSQREEIDRLVKHEEKLMALLEKRK